MNVPSMRARTRRTGTVLLLAVLGCTGCHQRDTDGVVVSAGRTEVMLAEARARHVSMFGDLPYTAGASFRAGSGVSARQHTFSEIGADFDADVDPAGNRIVFSSTRHSLEPDLYLKAIDGVAVMQLTSDPAADIQPSFSPDGSHVAFASHRSGNWDIWVIGTGGGPAVQVTTSVADEVHPSWSPDGKRLVFCSLPAAGGQWELWVADAQAGGTARFIGYGLFPEWSPVGDRIVFQRARERGSRWFSIWTLTLVDGEPRYPTELAASGAQAMILPTWSPDGVRLAFVSTATPLSQRAELDRAAPEAVFDIWVMDADGRGKVRVTDGFTANYAPAFGPDNRIFFTSDRAGHESIWSLIVPPVSMPAETPDAVTQAPFDERRAVRASSSD